MKRIVTLIAIDNRYKKSSYPFRPVFDERLGTYRTGQHIDPEKPETKDNLTLEEMRDPSKISAAKKKRFPYVLNPTALYNLSNRMRFDLTEENGEPVNPKQAAEFKMISEEGWFISPSRSEAVPRKHYFYIKDDIKEATKRIANSDLQYAAEKLIREEVDEDGLKDIALVLSYKVKSFDYTPGEITDLLLKDQLLTLCKTEPEKVLECKEEGTADDIYILKLAYHGIINRKGFDFYNGSEYMGSSLEEVKKWMKDESKNLSITKWNKILVEKEGRMPSISFKTKSKEKSEQEERIEKLQAKSIAQLKAIAKKYNYPEKEWSEFDKEEDMVKYLVNKK